METTTLSSKGQVIIPKVLRAAQHWDAGQEFEVVVVSEGVLLRPKAVFAVTDLNQVAGCLKTAGEAKSQAEIDAAMKRAARSLWRDRD
jgi:AbrB family looped-hinge helix DNA binding protein